MPTVDLRKIEAVLASRANVVAAWVFGSAREGEVRGGGDLDVGVLFDGRPGLGELADLRASLQKALEFEEIDLTPLNGASPILRFEAVSGRLLYCRDDNARAGFVSLTSREYEESMAAIEKQMRWRAEILANEAKGAPAS